MEWYEKELCAQEALIKCSNWVSCCFFLSVYDVKSKEAILLNKIDAKAASGFFFYFLSLGVNHYFLGGGGGGDRGRADNIPEKFGRVKVVKVITPLKKIDKI